MTHPLLHAGRDGRLHLALRLEECHLQQRIGDAVAAPGEGYRAGLTRLQGRTIAPSPVLAWSSPVSWITIYRQESCRTREDGPAKVSSPDCILVDLACREYLARLYLDPPIATSQFSAHGICRTGQSGRWTVNGPRPPKNKERVRFPPLALTSYSKILWRYFQVGIIFSKIIY